MVLSFTASEVQRDILIENWEFLYPLLKLRRVSLFF